MSIGNETIKPWVSFCMSTYKRPQFLEKTLYSILNQTFKNFEIVISDNDPEHSAEPVIQKINDERIKYYKNGGNLGMIRSFNKSIERSTTEYIVMITDDDPVYPEMLQTLYDLYIQYPGFGVYHGGCDMVFTTSDLAKLYNAKVGTNSCLSSDKSLGEITTYTTAEFPSSFFSSKINDCMLWSVGVVKKDILIDIGGIPDYGSPYLGDICYTILTCSHSGAVVINSSLGYHHVHGSNYCGSDVNDFEPLYKTPSGFYNWVFERMGKRSDWEIMKPEIIKFIARFMVSQCIVVKKYLTTHKLSDKDFNIVFTKIFKIPYLRKWKFKYYIALKFPILFKMFVFLKTKYLK